MRSMKAIKLILGALAILGVALAVFFVLSHEKALVTHPKGVIAENILSLIGTNYLLMLIIIVPTAILLFTVAWKYRAKNTKQQKYDPESSGSPFGEILLWIIPTLVITVMAIITWDVTHQLDPYRPLESDAKPLTIQVVALDWKWLFIYPEQGIATVNFVQFPERVPVRFQLSADNSPMNSFWLPQLSGQIYAMSGMITELHIMANAADTYTGRAAEINGEGFGGMTFLAKSTSQTAFDEWVDAAKLSPLKLTDHIYKELVQPSSDHPVTIYSYIEADLFNKVVMKYMHPEA